jgi:hypothetical protein
MGTKIGWKYQNLQLAIVITLLFGDIYSDYEYKLIKKLTFL